VIFVDTGAWYARYVVEDVDHEAAVEWFARVPDRLLTTDYVVDELLTLLKTRGYRDIAFAAGTNLFSVSVCQLEYVEPADVARAWIVFSTFRDKDWSFTDCVSKVVIERLGIKTACAFDEHFREFGSLTVVP
jgi:predicted nucleic acid-binding protein